MKIICNLAFLLVLQLLFACQALQLPEVSAQPGGVKTQKDDAAEANMVFRSADGGETWQNIGEGLPENLRIDTMRGISIVANDNGLFVRVGKESYHSSPNATAPFWTKEISPDQNSSIATGKPGRLYWGANLKKANGTIVWSPIFEILDRPGIRTAFEASGGAIFIATDKGIFKTVDNGETWKQVYAGTTVGHLAELDGILLATNNRRIIRSTDDGENWAMVTSDSSVAFDVKPIAGGFVVMTSTSETNPRGMRTSYDGGKTWQPSNAGNKVLIDSIWRTWNDRPTVKAFSNSVIQLGENIYFPHRDGIYRSSDKGKTWKLLLPSAADNAFSLLMSGNMMYALHSRGGC
jgi:photosystem II stability/assembly factor-like uncharacterized protein